MPWLAVLFGVALAANGIFMLVAPENWYFTVPGVTSAGPFNQHFLRDIGLIFLFLGGAYLVGAARPQMRVLLWGAPTIWLCGHALFHLWEVAVGICAPSVIARDFPAPAGDHRSGADNLGDQQRTLGSSRIRLSSRGHSAFCHICPHC